MPPPTAQRVTFDQCQYGLRNPDGALLRKHTTLLTNMPFVVAEFNDKSCSKHCREQNVHGIVQGHQQGMRVSLFVQQYPEQMVMALATACAQHLSFMHR